MYLAAGKVWREVTEEFYRPHLQKTLQYPIDYRYLLRSIISMCEFILNLYKRVEVSPTAEMNFDNLQGGIHLFWKSPQSPISKNFRPAQTFSETSYEINVQSIKQIALDKNETPQLKSNGTQYFWIHYAPIAFLSAPWIYWNLNWKELKFC